MATKTNDLPMKFPKKFLWGASTSAHQVEGNTNNQWSVWEKLAAKDLASQAEHKFGELDSWPGIKKLATLPANYVSASAVGHYDKYEQDFKLLEEMNMNAYRFSVEWSRIEPTEGSWSAEAIDHYKKYVATLKDKGVEPVVTLFHFTLPNWFVEMGGFEKRRNIQYFVRFAEKIISEFGSQVRYIITINEPEVYASESYRRGAWPPNITNKRTMITVLNNLASAHNQTASRLHTLNRRYKISIAKNSAYCYPGDTSKLSRSTARIMQYLHDDYLLGKVAKHCDFIGVNYYFSNRVYGYRVHNPNERVSDLGWDMSPADIQHVLERLHERYGLPLIVTENGLADGADESRQWWITQTLIAMQRALNNGVRLDGYLHWSLLDNLEWDKGRWPRFGLAEVNYTNGARTLRPSAIWFGRVIKKLRGI